MLMRPPRARAPVRHRTNNLRISLSLLLGDPTASRAAKPRSKSAATRAETAGRPFSARALL